MFAVYSTDYDPRRLYTADGAPGGTEHVETVVRFGDRPLDLLVETDRRRVLWTFRGRHSTTATRTGYFVADYQGEDLFYGLERQLRSLHESEGWSLPLDGELRWDAGFHLWRVDADLPGLDEDERAALFDALEEDVSLAFGVNGYHEALAVVRAVAETDVETTVGIAGVSDPEGGSLGRDDLPVELDLLVCPDVAGDFVPLTDAAEEVVDEAEPDPGASDDVGGGAPGRDGTPSFELSDDRKEMGWSPVGRAALGLVAGLLALSLLSFLTPNPVHPITGLSAIGAFVGSAVGLPAVVYHLLADDDEPGFITATRSAYGNYPDWTAAAVAYGTLAGYLFPFGWKAVGKEFDMSGPMFGSVTTPGIALPSVGLLLAGMVAIGWLIVQTVLETRERDLHRELVVSFAVGHSLYGVLVFLATGLAEAIWFGVIPSVS